MDSFFRSLDKGLDSLAGKVDQWSDKIEKKWNDGTGEEGLGDVYSINGSRYRVVKKLAEGGFAFVFLAEQVETGRPVALKRILVQDDEHMEIIKREINFLKTLSGKEGIIPFLGAASFRKPNRQEVIVLTEFCPRGSVLDLMHQRERNRMTEVEILFIFETVCKAVYHMHSQEPPIAHRDLKVENVLVGKGGALYLIDFGSASVVTYDTDKPHIRNIAENDINRNTTLIYRAPEMVDLYRKHFIDEKVDVWALGCMLYKMMYYADPFDGKLGILNARYRAPDFPPYTPKMHDLLKFLFTSDPEKRPDICDVLEKLGSSMPRLNRKPSRNTSASGKDKSPAQGRSENGSAGAGGKDLFAMLDWQKNDDSSASSSSSSSASPVAARRSNAREARARSPPLASDVVDGGQSLIDDFEQKVAITASNGAAAQPESASGGDFFAAFDSIRQPSPSASSSSSSSSASSSALAPSHSSASASSSSSSSSAFLFSADDWGDFSTFSSAGSSSSSKGAASASVAAAPSFGLDPLLGLSSISSSSSAASLSSPAASPAAARRQPEKSEILSLYAAPASGDPSSAPGLFGMGAVPSPPVSAGVVVGGGGGTYNSVPMGIPLVYAPAPTPVYVMAQQPLPPMASSPLYARAPSPLASGGLGAPAPYGSGVGVGGGGSPLMAHRGAPSPLGGGGGAAMLAPMSTPPLTPMGGRSGLATSSPAAPTHGAGGDPFADLWKTVSK